MGRWRTNGRLGPVLLVLFALATVPGHAVGQVEPLEWPREIVAPRAILVIYQPQLETFDRNQLTARAAVSVTPVDTGEPVFGAMWFAAKVFTDRDRRTVALLDLEVTDAKFPNATPEQLERIGDVVEANLEAWAPVISLDRVLTGLELAEVERQADDLNTSVPEIIVVTHPAALVTLDGEPELQPIEGVRLMRIANTPSLMVYEPLSRFYYLWDGSGWLMTQTLKGTWVEAAEPPDNVKMLVPGASEPPDTAATEVPAAPESTARELMPQIIVATEPTELIVLDGAPKLTPLEGTGLLYLSNTESSVFVDIDSQRYFVVLAGRWFAGDTLQGAWAFVRSDDLPGEFRRIPPGSPKGDVRPYVAGTDEAVDAVHETYIPQTTAIDRKTATVNVTYDGAPKFEPIEGTSMTYAVNTSTSVIRVEQQHYCCDQAVWFVADGPKGPWTVCTSVPQVIYTMPPSAPVYQVRFVQVYESTPDVVYVGYTPGYVGCYAFGGAVVYGTGFVYRGWRGAVYYPRPITYGFSFHYSSYTGSWGVGYGYGYGARRGVAIGPRGAVAVGPRGAVAVGPYGGAAVARRGWWGAGGYRHYGDIDVRRSVTTPRGTYTGRRTVERDGNDVEIGRSITTPDGQIHGRQTNIERDRDGSVDITRSSNIAGSENLYDRRENLQRNVESRREQRVDGEGRTRERPGVASAAGRPANLGSSRANDVFVDRDGHAFRRTTEGWQRRENGRWSASERDRGAASGQRGGAPGRAGQGSAGRSREQDLERQHQARQRGTQRTKSYQNARSAGGRSRGGRAGGRRR